MTTDARGLYVHVPFCEKKCNYCDFCSYAGLSTELREAYIHKLVREIESYGKEEKIRLDSLFFGGGTPSLLSVAELEKLFSAIRSSFEVSEGAEITLESNPKTLTKEKLLAYKSLGVNRLSIGLQTIHENELKKLGRIHTYADFVESYRLARQVGMTNINVDIMYGIPEQTRDSFLKTLEAVISHSPEHISAYGLIIEEGTPFFRMVDELDLPDEDCECDMYGLATVLFRNAGYSHYEISNYARDGYRSRHNLKYWCSCEYIGVGVAACSFFENKRYSNPTTLEKYLATETFGSDNVLPRSEYDAEFEFAMLVLRLKDGFSLSEYKERFGKDFTAGRERAIERYIELG